MKCLIDAYAWVEYFEGTEKGLKVKKIIDNPQNSIFSSVLTIAEMASKAKRSGKDAEEIIAAIFSLSSIVYVTDAIAMQAGLIHAEKRRTIKDFGLIDAFLLAHSQNENFAVVSGDKHFKGIKNAMLI